MFNSVFVPAGELGNTRCKEVSNQSFTSEPGLPSAFAGSAATDSPAHRAKTKTAILDDTAGKQADILSLCVNCTKNETTDEHR